MSILQEEKYMGGKEMRLSLSTLEARNYLWEAAREGKFYLHVCQHLSGTHLEGAGRPNPNTATTATANTSEGNTAHGEKLTATHFNTKGKEGQRAG